MGEIKPKTFWGILGFAFFLIALAYWPAVRGEFVYDDTLQIVGNSLIQDPSLFREAMTSDVWAFKSSTLEVSSNYYRPTFTALNIACFAAFGKTPAGWHIVNILLHALVTWLGFRLLLRVGAPLEVAAVTTWVFAAHPVHVESVTWIAGSPDLLMGVFLLGCLLIQTNSLRIPQPVTFGLITVCMFLAMGSKEVSVAAIPIALVLQWLVNRQSEFPVVFRQWRTWVPCIAPYCVGLVSFLVLKQSLIGLHVSTNESAPWESVFASAPSIVMFYLRQTLLPYELSTAYPVRAITFSGATLLNFWVPLIAMLAGLFGLAKLSKGHAVRIFGLVFFLATLAPVLYIRPLGQEDIVRDRYLYLPILGLFLVLADVAWGFIAQRKSSTSLRTAWIAGSVVGVALAFLCWPYNDAFMNETTMWKRAVATDPGAVGAHVRLAKSLIQEGSLGDAEDAAQKAVDLDPKSSPAYVALGLVHQKMYQYPKAVQAFEKAIELKPTEPFPYESLAAIFVDSKLFDRAIQVYKDQEAGMGRVTPLMLRNCTAAHILAERPEEAIAYLEERKAVLNQPMTSGAYITWFYLGDLYLSQDQPEKAKEALTRFVELAQQAPDAFNKRHVAQARAYLSQME